MSKWALISVYDKTNIDLFAEQLVCCGWKILSTGGTYDFLTERGIECTRVSDLTEFPEMMDGRVKTLHPKVFGGILADRSKHYEDMFRHYIPDIEIVIVNLYPFSKTLETTSDEDTITENIDVGGHSLIRAAAKNSKDVLVVVDPLDYQNVSFADDKERMAKKAWKYIADYDAAISNHYN